MSVTVKHIVLETTSTRGSQLFRADSRPGDYKLSCDQAITSILNIDIAIFWTIICE